MEDEEGFHQEQHYDPVLESLGGGEEGRFTKKPRFEDEPFGQNAPPPIPQESFSHYNQYNDEQEKKRKRIVTQIRLLMHRFGKDSLSEDTELDRKLSGLDLEDLVHLLEKLELRVGVNQPHIISQTILQTFGKVMEGFGFEDLEKKLSSDELLIYNVSDYIPDFIQQHAKPIHIIQSIWAHMTSKLVKPGEAHLAPILDDEPKRGVSKKRGRSDDTFTTSHPDPDRGEVGVRKIDNGGEPDLRPLPNAS